MQKLLKNKELTYTLCTSLNVLCMIVCLVTVFYNRPAKPKQVKEALSARSELGKDQVVVYRIYYNEKDTPTIKVERTDTNTPIDLKGDSHGG